MSHIVTVQTRITDVSALEAACRRLQLSAPVEGTAQLFGGEAKGWLVSLPGWQYPAVIDLKAGTIQFDNFEGNWGDAKEMDRLLQAYAVEKAKIEARKKGYACQETALEDGSIKLEILEGASA